jgi:hypothetical protein
VFTEDKLKTRAKSMLQEFMQFHDEEELLLAMDEVLGSPNAGKIIVQTNIDYSVDCKPAERAAIIEIIAILFSKDKLTSLDVKEPMADIVEFIDSYVCDSPGVFGYVGDMVSTFMHVKALDVIWLCDATSRCPESPDKLKVIDHTIQAMKSKYGDAETRACFGGANETRALESLLGPDFQSIARKL